MKNKQKMWRRLARKSVNESGDTIRNGRMLRQLTIGHYMRGGTPGITLTSLFERAGIIIKKPTIPDGDGVTEVETANEAE